MRYLILAALLLTGCATPQHRLYGEPNSGEVTVELNIFQKYPTYEQTEEAVSIMETRCGDRNFVVEDKGFKRFYIFFWKYHCKRIST